MKKVLFNDGWTYGEDKTPVIIPHDGMLYSDRDPNSINGSAKGFFDGGIYTYNKSFLCL